jgi:deoxycytidine triphosphate deaminase
MFISPSRAIGEGWITGVTNNPSPNAIDFTLDRLFSINEKDTFYLDNDSKKMRGQQELFPDSNGNWLIPEHSVCDGHSAMFVEIPEGVVALLIIRSSLSRNGLYLTSGLYDSGFSGHIGFVLHNRSGPTVIRQGTRIGQIMFVEADNVGVYQGDYNHQKGTHYTD